MRLHSDAYYFFQIKYRQVSFELLFSLYTFPPFSNKMADRYSFSLTTFSPSGKLVQIEYALNAVSQGVTSVGIKGKKIFD